MPILRAFHGVTPHKYDSRGLCDPETTDLHGQQRASVRPHWVRFPSQKRITGHIALIGRAPASTTVSTQWEGAGSSPAVSAVAVACAVTRTHHPCKAVCKRKNLGVSPLRPSFIGSSVLSDAVQRRTMLYKTRYKYRYIYRGPNVFKIELPGCAR